MLLGSARGVPGCSMSYSLHVQSRAKCTALYQAVPPGLLSKTAVASARRSPPWTPLFAIASAVVTDFGGPLAHCAIVAREYGIPAVVGIDSATTEIQDGDTVTVDGISGVVTVQSN
ncbi:MAG: PEP-utilizing enzyme [Dehalococcoidia bacterium]